MADGALEALLVVGLVLGEDLVRVVDEPSALGAALALRGLDDVALGHGEVDSVAVAKGKEKKGTFIS